MRRRTALGLGLFAALSPSTLTTVLRDSAAEAMEFTRERSVSAVGKGTLQHLTTVVANLDRAFGWRPGAELFPVARYYRQRVEQLLGGKHTLAEGRELHVHGAYLSHILSDLAWDLGSAATSEAYAIDSDQLAEQAGHHELRAWAADSLAHMLQWTGRPGEAIDAALRGQRRAPRRHLLRARMLARAAYGHARQGNGAACVELLDQARTVCEYLPDEISSRLGTDSAEHVSLSIVSYSADCHVELGDWRDAERQARLACEVGRWSPGRAAGAKLNLATALANLGSPDEAAHHGMQALPHALGRLGSVRPRAQRLDAVLMRRYPKDPGALEFHEQYQQLASRALTN